MKKNLALSLHLLFVHFSTFFINAEISPHIITFFIRPLPLAQEDLDKEKLERKITTPGNITKSIIKKELNITHLYSGIYASYAGYVALSDIHGQLTFPRKTTQNTLHLLVAQDLKAIPLNPLKKNTILGFVLNPKALYQYYNYERQYNSVTNQYAWHISQKSLAAHKQIPYDTIIVFANPNHIKIPLGTFITGASENLVLPDIYTTKQLSSGLNALRFLKIRHFFAPVKMVYNFKTDSYQQRVIN